jgi:hypothetical protein
LLRLAESSGAAVHAVCVPAGAMRLVRQPHRFGVERLLGHLDEDQIRDREQDQRSEELPR